MNGTATLTPPATSVKPVDEEALYEVVNGHRVELPPMSIYASIVSFRISTGLHHHAAPRRLGTVTHEALFMLDPVTDLRRRPDVGFVSAAKWPLDRLLPASVDWQIVPDLAIEVVSPNDQFEDVLAKMREYLRLGVQQVWIVLPNSSQIYIYDTPTQPRVLTADDELDGGALLPGLSLKVGSLFQGQAEAAPAAPSTAAP